MNEYLLRKREVYSRADAIADAKTAWRSLASDQQATGMVVAFMEHLEFGWLDGLLGADIQDTIDEIKPEELEARHRGRTRAGRV